MKTSAIISEKSTSEQSLLELKEIVSLNIIPLQTAPSTGQLMARHFMWSQVLKSYPEGSCIEYIL